jgi:hypothetical protein
MTFSSCAIDLKPLVARGSRSICRSFRFRFHSLKLKTMFILSRRLPTSTQAACDQMEVRATPCEIRLWRMTRWEFGAWSSSLLGYGSCYGPCGHSHRNSDAVTVAERSAPKGLTVAAMTLRLRARTISFWRHRVYEGPLIRRVVWWLLNRVFVGLRIRLRVFVRLSRAWRTLLSHPW